MNRLRGEGLYKLNQSPYEMLLRQVLTHGEKRDDRTGTGTLSIFGTEMRFDLRNGTLPLITTKFVSWKTIAHELLWFLSGDTNIKYLQDNGVKIWDEWADESGNLGPVYGAQWRSWTHTSDHGVQVIDQIADVIDSLKNNPNSRRHIVSAWNVGEIDDMALPPCHMMFQLYVSGDGKLSCKLTQRSADMFLGVPYNIASYAMLTHMIAQQAGLTAGELIWSGGDTHIYLDHIEQVKEQLTRSAYEFPQLILQKAESIDDYTIDHFHVMNYQSHPALKGKVSV